MSDENPYLLPNVDETQWFKGSHLGTQIQAANWQIVNCTTPANFFHVLRRQVSAGGRRRGLGHKDGRRALKEPGEPTCWGGESWGGVGGK